jgi:hypothetical protein
MQVMPAKAHWESMPKGVASSLARYANDENVEAAPDSDERQTWKNEVLKLCHLTQLFAAI